MPTKKVELDKKLERSFSGAVLKEFDEEKRTVEIAFSSEEPYERYFGMEVLDHSPQSMRLARLESGAAVLVNHDYDDQVGVVESARIDEDRKGRAVIRFSRSQRGEEIFNDVKDGIRQLVSVGYTIHKYEVTEREGQLDEVRVTDWEPHELSIVSVPADPSVGVGRSKENEPTKKVIKMDKQEIEKKEVKADAPVAPAVNVKQDSMKDEQKRIDMIKSMGESVGVETAEAIASGMSYEDFRVKAHAQIGERNAKAVATSKHDGNVDLTAKQQKQFSLVNLMNAAANPASREAQERAKFELEVSQAAIDGFGSGFQSRGLYVPNFALRTLTAGTATDGAELVADNLLAGSFIDVLRNKMISLQAGAQLLSGLVGNVSISRKTSASTATWNSAENTDAGNSEPQFDEVTLTPKDLSVYADVSRRLLQQSTPSVDGLVQDDLARGIALALDAAVFNGSGDSGQPTGIKNTTGINKVVFGAADPTFAEIIQMIKEVMVDNADVGALKWILDPNGWEALSSTAKQSSGVEGNFILNEMTNTIKGYGYLVSNQITAEDYYFGNFNDVLIGEWGGMELTADPYTLSLKGAVRFIGYKTADIAVRHPESFCLGNDTP